MKNLVLLLSLFLLVLGCKDEAGSSLMEEKATLVNMAKPKMDSNTEADMEVAAAEEAPPPVKMETKIIKTANLRFETSNLTSSFENIQKAVQKHKAIVQNDEAGKDDYSSYRNLSIRIPNQDFDAFIAEISQGVTHFDKKEISQQDVTEEFIDVEARMNAKKKLEARYLQLLTKANKVSEMLEIEKQLAEIREEIEAKEGQLKYMQSRVSMSTIDIEMYTENPSQSGATVSYGGKIWNAIKSGFYGLSNFIVGIISMWPFILIFVLLFVLIKRRFFKKKE